MRPCFAVDVDGVLVDFTTPALAFINSQGITKTLSQVTKFSVFDNDEVLEERFKCEVASKPGFCRQMQAYPGAIEFVRALTVEYDVMIVTAAYDVSGWYEGRRDWVVDNLALPRKNVSFLTRKEFFDSDIFLDDKVENVVTWHERRPNKLAMLMDQPWNRESDYQGVKRVRDWIHIARVLEENGLPSIDVTFELR